MFYDYAGNVSAEEVSLSDDLLEWVNPIAEKQVLQVGEKITLRNEIDTDMTIWTQWKTSDANIARIAEVPNNFYGGEFCVLEAVSPGTVTISAGFGNWGRWMKEVEITVVPNEFAIIQQPTSVETIPGETVTFAVRTTRDDSCAYQWQEFLADSQTWQDCQLPGAHTAMLQVLAEASRNGQQFRCVVTDSDGAVLESEVATLTILHHGDHTDLSVVGVKEATCLEEGVHRGHLLRRMRNPAESRREKHLLSAMHLGNGSRSKLRPARSLARKSDLQARLWRHRSAGDFGFLPQREVC